MITYAFFSTIQYTRYNLSLNILGYCFSASLPPFLAQIATTAIDVLENDPSILNKLKLLSIQVDEKLREIHEYDIISDPPSPSKIIIPKSKDNNVINAIHDFVSIRE